MQNVLITGASSGIGMETALELAERGYRVIATMRDPARSTELVARADGRQVSDHIRVEKLDVTEPSPVIAGTVADLIGRLGRLDALINNAGTAEIGPVELMPEESWHRMMETNFFGALRCMKAVLPHMRTERHGTIINISSISGRMGYPGFGAYSASKFALEALSEVLRSELAPFGVKVVLVEPGNYRTHIGAQQRDRDPVAYADEASAYAELIAACQDFLETFPETGDDPGDVARLIGDILADAHPTLRYPVGRVGDVSVRELIERHLAGPWEDAPLGQGNRPE